MSSHHLRCRVLRGGHRAGAGGRVPALRRADRRRLRLGAARADAHARSRSRPARRRCGATASSCRRARSVDVGAGWTRLVPCEPLSDLLERRPPAEAREREPDALLQGPRRDVAVSAALDHGVTTLCCSSTGNLGDAVAAAAAATGLEAVVLVPEGSASAAVEAEHRGVHVLAVRGTLRRLPPARARARLAVPVGLRQRQPPPVRERGREDDLVRDRRAARLAAARRSRLPGRERHALREAHAGVRRADARRPRSASRCPRMFAAQALGSSPIASAFADDRGISRVRADTHVASLAVGDPSYGDLALGAARATGGAVLAVAEDEIAAYTELLTETTGVAPDASGGAALGALIAARRSGEIEAGSQVVLVVTGARPELARRRAARADDRPRRGRRARRARPRLVAFGRAGHRRAAPPRRPAARARSSARCSSSRKAPWLLELVERIRRASQTARRDGTVADVERERLEAREQALVLRAFGLYFQLANLAEQLHRLRRRREDARHGAIAPRVARRGVPARRAAATANARARRRRSGSS